MTRGRDDTPGRRLAREVHQRLKTEIRRAGRGWASRIDRSFGKAPGWLRKRRSKNRIQLADMLDAVERLGLDPARFLWQALGAEAGGPGGLGLDRPRGEPPEIVLRARERVARGKTGDGTESITLVDELLAVAGGPFVGRLDELRYEDPRRVVRLAEKAVDHVRVELLPRLLGVAGSAYRLWSERLEEAQHCVDAGLAIAKRRGDRLAIGNLLQRAAYIVADRGDYADALRIAERATLRSSYLECYENILREGVPRVLLRLQEQALAARWRVLVSARTLGRVLA